MAILGSTAYIFAVINVKDGNLLFAYEFVKMVDDSVKIVNDIIATVMCMAGIKARRAAFRCGQHRRRCVQVLRKTVRSRFPFLPSSLRQYYNSCPWSGQCLIPLRFVQFRHLLQRYVCAGMENQSVTFTAFCSLQF